MKRDDARELITDMLQRSRRSGERPLFTKEVATRTDLPRNTAEKYLLLLAVEGEVERTGTEGAKTLGITWRATRCG